MENECYIVGFAPLSAGVFRGDRGLDNVLAIGVGAIHKFLSELELEQPPMEVHVVAYSSEELNALLAKAALLAEAARRSCATRRSWGLSFG